MGEWVMNRTPHTQPLAGSFSWADLQTGLGAANAARPGWLADGVARSWREQGGMTCSINPSRMSDVKAWVAAGHMNTTSVVAAGTRATQIPITDEWAIVLDPEVPSNEAHWRWHWEKAR